MARHAGEQRPARSLRRAASGAKAVLCFAAVCLGGLADTEGVAFVGERGGAPFGGRDRLRPRVAGRR